MFLRGLFLPLLVVGFVACEPIGKKEDALDSSAVFDQKPLRAEGWTVEGQSSAAFDGMILSTAPSSKSDGVSQQEFSPNNASMFKKFLALNGSSEGTLRLKFSFPKLSQSAIRFDISFATGLGLPSELRITDSGLTAKCGYLNLVDGAETISHAKKFEALKDYEIRIVRTASSMNVLLDKEVVVKDLACTTLQDANEEPRSAGHLKLTLFSQIPSEPMTWKASDLLLYQSQILLKRVTIYRDTRLD